MNYPEGLTGAAICQMEGHEWRNGGICIYCGERLRCLCGQFVRSDQLDQHVKNCPTIEEMQGGCPICEGGKGSACSWHFI